jgi:hypothetical protein
MQLPASQATTQPYEVIEAGTPSEPLSIIASATPITTSRKRATTSVRQQSASTLWAPCPCPVSINAHYNAVDRGLCAQTLREHHTILERAMVRLYPRFKWRRSHYLQVIPLYCYVTCSHAVSR